MAFGFVKGAASRLADFGRGRENIQLDVDPLIDGLVDGVESLTDLVISLFPIMVIIGILTMVVGLMIWRGRR